MYVCICLLVGILGASATIPAFQYYNLGSMYRRSDDDCKICYGNGCLTLDQARCEYYVQTDQIVREEYEDSTGEDPQLRITVDNMMFEFMEMASTSAVAKECIPFVSHYTDCTKENICIGCTRCYCNGQGRWNCTTIHQCRADDAKVDVDHRLLMIVMENLANAGKPTRRKRSMDDKNKTKETDTIKLSFEGISEWLYGAKPSFADNKPSLIPISEEDILNYIHSNNITNGTTAEVIATVLKTNTTDSFIKSEIKTDTDHLTFNEVLNIIAGDNRNYSRRKPVLNVVHNDSLYIDYINIDEKADKTDYYTVTNQLVYTLGDINDNGVTESDTGANKVIIDLLGLTKRNDANYSNINVTDYADIEINDINPLYDDIEFNALNIMKRFVSSDTNVTKPSTEITHNVTMTLEDLKNNALFPLGSIISVKQKELEELFRIRESLITFLNSYNNDTDTFYSIENETENGSNSYFSIYKLEIVPELEIEYDSRRNNPNLQEKYLKKLKRDIHEVIKDIKSMQKLSGSIKIPDDLKILLRAMKYYVHKQRSLNKDIKVKKSTNYRRQLDAYVKQPTSKTVEENLVKIFQIIDKNMPDSNALAPLSPIAKKIVARIINQNYVDEFTVIGLRVSDTNYNLTNDLRNIGNQWQNLTQNVAQSSALDKIYAMKILHLALAVDMGKMTNALALIDFAHSRRMVPIDGHIGEEIMGSISRGLSAINDKIQIIIKVQNSESHRMKTNMINLDDNKKSKKESFLQKLRNILRNSKKDIAHLLKKKVPKAEIVKEIAKNKLDEMTRRRFLEFEATMRKWQTNLNITNREKRSARYTTDKKRIKNIIPKYLRGKVNPVRFAKGFKKLNFQQEKVNEPYKKIMASTTAKTKTASVRLNKMKRRH